MLEAGTILLGVIIGIVSGAAVLSLLMVLAFHLFARQALADGQFVLLIPYLTVPLGGFVGGMAGGFVAYLWLGSPSVAGWAWWTGGVCVFVLTVLFTWCRLPGRSEAPWLWLTRSAGRWCVTLRRRSVG